MNENYFGLSDTGKMRDNNEDAFIAERILKDRYIMACVIDGVGGYEGGEIAAHIARENILSYFSIPSGEMITMMREAMMLANEKIYEERLKEAQNQSMACVLTMAVADIENHKFYYAHIGDTRLYLFRDNSLVKITKDHSFVGFLEDTGRLTEEEAMNHPKRNEINKALGFDAQMRSSAEYIETGESPFLPGDILLLCSDGLSDMVSNKEITSILINNKTLAEKCKSLVEAANNSGGKDNITVVLVQNDATPVKQKATKPVLIKKNEPQVNDEPVKEPTQLIPAQPIKTIKARSYKGLAIFLSIFSLVLLGLLLWPFLKSYIQQSPPRVVPVRQQNPLEKKLSDTLNHVIADSLLLADNIFLQPVSLSDTLFIQRDSLVLSGTNQLIIRADSGFKGPAIMLSATCKYILLENIRFENFDIGIVSPGNALHLKNVVFKNCRVPIQQQFIFPDTSYITGSINDTSFFKTDSLVK
jgi:serine/threonine protein phosphatase PrpC